MWFGDGSQVFQFVYRCRFGRVIKTTFGAQTSLNGTSGSLNYISKGLIGVGECTGPYDLKSNRYSIFRSTPKSPFCKLAKPDPMDIKLSCFY